MFLTLFFLLERYVFWARVHIGSMRAVLAPTTRPYGPMWARIGSAWAYEEDETILEICSFLKD